MSLAPGTRIGPYEVVAPLGVGGMGEVYRGRDSRLKRDVALKLLPASFAADPDRLARFEREAQALAALNHPNIAVIYGLEEMHTGQAPARTLVLELVEGDTLAELIARGAIPVNDALAIARQIADALEAAHEQGIVHRDLKPANVKITPGGVVKVLDFGLAKLDDQGVPGRVVEPAHNVSMSPTMTSPFGTARGGPFGTAQNEPAMMTGAGALLGTAAYMAPEQARGKPVDKRADIWAFGVVLYEMLSGARGFAGETVFETAGAVIHTELDWSQLPKDTPPLVRTVLKRCLHKEPKQRARDIGDVRLALEGAFAPDLSPPAIPIRSGNGRRRLVEVGGAALIAGVVVGAGVWTATRPDPPVRHAIRVDVAPPALATMTPFVSLSPDGRSFAFIALAEGAPQLWIHSLESGESRALLTAGFVRTRPHWSPDSTSLVFAAEGKIKRISSSGGLAEVVCDAAGNGYLGAAWNQDDVILFADGRTGIMQVSAKGGVPIQVTAVDTSRGEEAHGGPAFLPDGRHFVYLRKSTDSGHSGIYVGAIDTKPDEQDLTRLVSTGISPAYAPSGGTGTGHVLFMRDGLLMAQTFDESRRLVTGEAVPVAERVGVINDTFGSFSVSANGTLAYRRGDEAGAPVWVDRGGSEQSAIGVGSLKDPRNPRLSPDGRSLALSVDGDIWTYDLEGRPPVKLTFDGGNFSPLWTHDGTRIVYERGGGQGPTTLFAVPADGSGGTTEPVAPEGHFHPQAWSADRGELVVVQVPSDTGKVKTMDILRLAPLPTAEPHSVVATPAGETSASLSPDGRWLAYTADTTGRAEIWVRPFPGPGSAIRVSPKGGAEPVWARNGREVFYLEGSRVMSVVADTSGGFNFTPPSLLFESRYAHRGQQPPTYDVAADGRFVMIKPSTSPDDPTAVILNWTELLRRRDVN